MIGVSGTVEKEEKYCDVCFLLNYFFVLFNAMMTFICLISFVNFAF